MPETLAAPLGGPPPPEIPLSNSPLVRVLAQVVLPGILKIGMREEATKFQEEVRRAYPIFEEQSGAEVRINLGAAMPILQSPNANSIWRFSDASREWRVSLAPAAIALEAMAYRSRADFLRRWSEILEIVQRMFEPQIAQRIGLRYLDQITGDGFANIHTMIRSEMLGMTGESTRRQVTHAVSEALLDAEDASVLLRWGILPPNVVIDPNLMTPHADRSWVLDVDVFALGTRTFDHDALDGAFDVLANRAYAIFRYIVNDDFLSFYGASR